MIVIVFCFGLLGSASTTLTAEKPNIILMNMDDVSKRIADQLRAQ